MSFKINWDSIEKNDLSSFTINLLNESLNSGKRPNILSSDIKIIDLNFGNIAPDFEILEIGDLDHDKFRGIFNFKYQGNASITINTKIQASPLKNYEFNLIDYLELNENESNFDEISNFINPNFNLANSNFDIPLNLCLSNIKLSSIIIIVFSKTKGLTLVFKNDPLESISINSTFDKIKPVANFLKKKIELQITEIFKEFLPSFLYNLSLKYTTNNILNNLHQNLLNENENDRDDKRVNLIELDNENSLKILPGSLMRLTTLFTSKLTLSLNENKDSIINNSLNNNVISKSSLTLVMNNMINLNSNNKIYNKFQLNEMDFNDNNFSDNLSLIKDFQSKFYYKNNYADLEVKQPKRRSIKINKKPSKRENTPPSSSSSASATSTNVPSSITTSTSVSASTSSTSTSTASPKAIDDKLSSVELSRSTAMTSSMDDTLSSDSTLIDEPTKSTPIKKSTSLNNDDELLNDELETLNNSMPSSTQPSSASSSSVNFKNFFNSSHPLNYLISIPNNNGTNPLDQNDRSPSPSNSYHIDKDEKLKINSRREQLDKIFNYSIQRQNEKLRLSKANNKDNINNSHNSHEVEVPPPPPYCS